MVTYLFDNTLLPIVQIDALHLGLAVEAEAIEGEIGINVLGMFGTIGDFGDASLIVSKVKNERLDTFAFANGLACRNSCTKLEVGAESTDGHLAVGIIELVAVSKEQLRVVSRIEMERIVKTFE